MTNEEILKKAMEKVYTEAVEINIISYSNLYRVDVYFEKDFPSISVIHEAIIFSHDFAKAFWGENLVCNVCGTDDNIPSYKHNSEDITVCVYGNAIKNYKFHLKQMVIEENPLKYLEKFL